MRKCVKGVRVGDLVEGTRVCVGMRVGKRK